MLINGAGGGSGSFAIQLAKRLGAHVTGVDNARKSSFMSALGADEVIDYDRNDFTRHAGAYDLILRDLAAHRSVFAIGVRSRTRGQVSVRRWFGADAASRAHPWLRGRAADPSQDRGARRQAGCSSFFEPLGALCLAGEVSIHIDRTFTLDEVPAALAHVGQGRALGKVVIRVS